MTDRTGYQVRACVPSPCDSSSGDCACAPFYWPGQRLCISDVKFATSNFSSDYDCAFGAGFDPVIPPIDDCIARLPNNFGASFSCAFGVGNDPNPPPDIIDPPLPPDDSDCVNSEGSNFSCAFGAGFGAGEEPDPEEPPIDIPPTPVPRQFSEAYGGAFE